jgi:hypothetical protein
MNSKDPKSTALRYNKCINNQDLEGLKCLMAKNHVFIDREDKIFTGPTISDHINGWRGFFSNFPDYKNTFIRVELRDNVVILHGYAVWSKEEPTKDYVIWTAKIEDDLVAEWRIYKDTEENRTKFGIS